MKGAWKTVGAVVGAMLSVVLVLSAFFRWNFDGQHPLLTPRFSLPSFWHQIPNHLSWMVPFILLSLSLAPLRAVQWQATLPARVPFKERYHWVAIGLFIHNVFPGKLGDFARAFFLARTQRLPFVTVLGSVAVCKLLEFSGLMLLVALSLLGPFGKRFPQFIGPMEATVTVCLFLMVAVIALARFGTSWAQALEKQKRWPVLQRLFKQIGTGFGAARSLRGMTQAFALSLGPVLASSIAYGLALEGVGVRGAFFAGTVVLGAISLGQGIPGIPVGMGIYYFVTSWAARNLGATDEAAAALAVLTHLCTVASGTLLGAVSLWVRKIRIRDLKPPKQAPQDGPPGTSEFATAGGSEY